MKNQLSLTVLAAIFCLVTAGCGSISKLTSPTQQMPNLSKFTKVVVKDFENNTNKYVSADSVKQDAYNDKVDSAGRNFADMIATELRVAKIFEEVLRESPDLPEESTLVISGGIMRYEEGNAAARFWIGMGIGSSYFDALVHLQKQNDNELVGELKVDKNSWWLGGGHAAGQNVESFMKLAAQKLAQEMVKAKQGEKTDIASKNSSKN